MKYSGQDVRQSLANTEVSMVEIFKAITVKHDKHIKYEFQPDS